MMKTSLTWTSSWKKPSVEDILSFGEKMDFELSDELKMIQSLARDFVNDRLKPLERDILGRMADLSDARTYVPEETEKHLIRVAQETGLWGAGVPEELGGAGLSVLGNCLVEEELAGTAVPFNFGDVSPLLFDCNDRQMEKYFLPALNGQKRPYLALMEPDRSSDISAIGLRAEKKKDYYLLEGEKVSFSRPGKDYFALVFAVTSDSGVTAREGITCFLVDRDTPGFSVSGGEEKTGWRSQAREPMTLTYKQCRVTEEDILGEEGRAFNLGKKYLPARRIIRGARSLGVARRLLEEAATRAQSWESFGDSIAIQTGVQAGLADIAADIHACRLVVYEAAWKADEGKSIRRETALVKLFATQMLHRVADRVTQIYGGPPHIAGLPMEQLCRSALAASATELALELQRNIIARDILKGLKV